VNQSELLKKVRAIELAARRLVQQGMAGQYLSAFRGTGMQFREFRNYVWGDDVRHISWTVSARTPDPVIKTFEEERERTLFLVVDVSASLRKGPWAEAKAQRLAEIAGTLAVSAAESNDKFGLLMYSDQIEKVVPPGKGKTHLLRIIRDVLAFEPKGKGTDPSLALKQLDQVLKKQSIVFLLTDMEKLPSEEVLRRTTILHDFVCIAVEDSREWELANWGYMEVESAERGRPATLDTRSGSLKSFLFQHFETRKLLAQEAFKRARSDILWVDAQEDFVPVLQNYFKRRKAGG